MAYIPLDEESKVKGKAAIDVVGARLGKSGGGWIITGLLLSLGSFAPAGTKPIEMITPLIALFSIGVIVAWMYAVKALSKQYTELTGETTGMNEKKPASQEPVGAKA